MIRPSHIIVLVIVLVVLFGAKRLPEVARSIGQSMKVFKKEISDLQDDAPASSATPPPAPVVPPAQVTQPAAGTANGEAAATGAPMAAPRDPAEQ